MLTRPVTRPCWRRWDAFPRETFVPHFFSLPDSLKTGTPADVREWHIDGDGGDEPALNLVYDIDRALGIRRDAEPTGPTAGAGITSTASAPRLVAAMLERAQLATGMRILEIGTGSGYNAALMRELVGPQGQVTTVDIDGTLVAEASERLNAAGYDDIEVAGRGWLLRLGQTGAVRQGASHGWLRGCGPCLVGPVGPRRVLSGPPSARRIAPARKGGAKS